MTYKASKKTCRSSFETPVVHILYPHEWDVDDWAERNFKGLEPDRYQYGFNRLEKYGFKVTFCSFPKTHLIRKIGSLFKKLFKMSFDPYYFVFQLKHFLAADIFINPLDYEGLLLCWLRKYNIFGLRKKKHIFIAPWLSVYVQSCSEKKLKKYKELLATVDMCMYYCENEKTILKRYLDIPDEKLARFFFGVDQDFYTPRERPEDNFILAPGNDSFRDFEILSEVFRKLPDEKLYIASKRRIANSELPPNIHYLDLKNNRELLDYYRKAKIILIPIKKDCPTSSGTTVLMESLLLKKPVIVTTTPFHKEIIGNRDIAHLIEPENPQAIIEALTVLSNAPSLRKKISEQGRTEALTNFTSEHCMKKLAELIQKLQSKEESRKLKIHILYPREWDIEKWEKDYDKGLLPDKYQYGFDQLENYGFNVTYARFPQSMIINKVGNIFRRIFKYTLDLYYLAFQWKHLLNADIFISPLDHEGLQLCWLRKHKLLNLHNKKHIFITAWLAGWVIKASRRDLKTLRSLVSTVDTLMHFGESDKQIYTNLLAIPEEKLKKINWGVDSNFFQSVTNTNNGGYFFAPGNDIYRDFETLAKVALELPQERFIIASPRKLTLKPKPSNLTIVSKTHKEMIDLYIRSKAVIVPLKKDCHTSSGITVLAEALLLNKRIIVSSTDLMKEFAAKWKERVTLPVPESTESLKDVIINYKSEALPTELTPQQRKSLDTESYMRDLAKIICSI